MQDSVILDYANVRHHGHLMHALERKGKWRLDLGKVELRKPDSPILKAPPFGTPWEEWGALPCETVLRDMTQSQPGLIHGDFAMFRTIIELLQHKDTVPHLTHVLFGKQLCHGVEIFFPHSLTDHTFTVYRIEKVKVSDGRRIKVEEKKIPITKHNRSICGMSLNMSLGKETEGGPPRWIGRGMNVMLSDENIGMFHSRCYWLFVDPSGLEQLAA